MSFIAGIFIFVIGILSLTTTAAHLAKELRSFYPANLPKISVQVLDFVSSAMPRSELGSATDASVGKPTDNVGFTGESVEASPITPPPITSVPLRPSIEAPLDDQTVRQAAVPGSVPANEINIKSIALVRCVFRSQYYEISQQKGNEERFNVGTGIVVTQAGHLVTARHITDIDPTLKNDPSDRVWNRYKCHAALTDKDQTPIPAYGDFAGQLDPRFREVEIIFTAGDEVYLDGSGLDLAILKIKEAPSVSSGQAYEAAPIFPHLIGFENAEELLAVGYPGKVVLTPQTLERFDGRFEMATFYKKSLCGEGFVPCGFRYVLSRWPLEYADRAWQKSEYGIYTPNFRGGFSGAPVFFKGNFVGIVTHLNTEDENTERVIALTSFDIFESMRVYKPELLK